MAFDASDTAQVTQAFDHLQEQLNATQQANQDLRTQLHDTQIRRNQANAQADASGQVRRHASVISSIPEYGQAKLQHGTESFHHGHNRTGFVASLLSGQALDWVTPYLERNEPIMRSRFAFEEKFMAMFDDPHRSRTAAIKLAQLRQGRRSVVAYTTEFRRIPMDTNFNDNSLMVWFRGCLSDAISYQQGRIQYVHRTVHTHRYAHPRARYKKPQPSQSSPSTSVIK